MKSNHLRCSAILWILGKLILLGTGALAFRAETCSSHRGWSQASWSPSSLCMVEQTQPKAALSEKSMSTRIPSATTTTTTRARSLPFMDVLSDMAMGSKSTRATTEAITRVENRADPETSTSEYQRGLVTIGGITLIFASNSPVLHAAFSSDGTAAPPVLLLNAAVSLVALVGLLLGGESLESNTPLPSTLEEQSTTIATTNCKGLPGDLTGLESPDSGWPPSALEGLDGQTLRGGCELGLWKFLGTTANLYGLALTTAGHAALLIQLTTLIVPVVQGIQGVPIPRRIQWSVVLALAGVVCFTQDPTGTPSATGDALCVVAALFYATYDLRLFAWGKKVAPRNLITTKIGTQAICSIGLLLAVNPKESLDYLSRLSLAPDESSSLGLLLPVILWSGVAVNAVAPFLQVGGQQAIGPTRCQTIYASQPLWAALLSFVFLGETIGLQGWVGGSAFVTALFLAATAEAPEAECGQVNCEV